MTRACLAALIILSSSCTSSTEPQTTDAPESSPASASCTLNDVAADLQSIFESLSRPGPTVEELFAPEPDFVWFSLNPPPALKEQLPRVSIHDPEKLEPYFQKRARFNQRLAPSEAVISLSERRASAGVSISGTFRANDVAGNDLYFGGKAVLDCATGVIEVMSLGVKAHRLPTLCPAGSEAVDGMRFCAPRAS